MQRIPVLALVMMGSCATPTPDAIEDAFRRVDAAHRPYLTRKQEDFDRQKEGDDAIVSLLPAGYWGLLIDAFPDRAYARYAPLYENVTPRGILARWGLVRLAERRHRPTLEFFRRLLDSKDDYERGLAVRMLAHSGDRTLAPRLLAMIPMELTNGLEVELTHDLLSVLIGCRPPDAAVEPLLHRFKDETWMGIDSLRMCFEVAIASDPAAAVSRLLFETREEKRSYDSLEEFLAEFAVREHLVSMAPVFRRRVRQEIETYRENDEEARLRPKEPMLPQRDAFWGFRGPFLLAAYRVALRDLGVPLEPEERDWLESQRLLRPPAEYLIEAGILPR